MTVPGARAGLPAIASRLARALLAWSLVWSLGVAAAVGVAIHHEVEDLLDDTLEAFADVMAGLLRARPAPGPVVAGGLVATNPRGRPFAWQVVDAQARVLQRSGLAPSAPFAPSPSTGYARTPGWRVYGVRLDTDGRMLYVAQPAPQRLDAKLEVALTTVLAAAAIGLLGHLWLRRRVARELEPLQRMSQRLATHEPHDDTSTLGPAERAELAPVHAAIDGLARRLAQRLAHERAFTAHAAHALRTPLAGIDAQLAVALREAPEPLVPRLRRVREGTARLQRVVAALLALFRSGHAVHREPTDLCALVARLPVEPLAVSCAADAPVDADPDLLAAALLNLLDNASRCGAQRVAVDVPRPHTVRLHDDGPGIAPARREALQSALDRQAYEGVTGLGLMLADLVARSHGGSLQLPDVARGFAVELVLGPGASARSAPTVGSG